MIHQEVWQAIDNFAFQQQMSCSGLARFSGLDATTFNKSNRWSKYGQPIWPPKVQNCSKNPKNRAFFAIFLKKNRGHLLSHSL